MYRRALPDGRLAELDPLTFGRARLVVWTPERFPVLDDQW
jgi:hypothetical protein